MRDKKKSRRLYVKSIFFISLFLILISSAFSQSNSNDYIEGIYDAAHLTLNVTLSSSIDIIRKEDDSKIKSLSAKVNFIPVDTWRQRVQTFKTSAGGNIGSDSVSFLWFSPAQNSVDYSIQATVATQNKYVEVKEKVPFPIDASSLDSSLKVYLNPSNKIDSDNSEIIKFASSLAEGEDDLFILSHKIARFVRENVKYDLNTITAEATQKASWVLESRSGVCDELSVLFISFMRALGVPARFVSGISYTDSDLFDERWGAHGWAEVYFPKYGWIPFDVTYEQLGFIDASHITASQSIDPDKPSGEYAWTAFATDIKPGQLRSNVKLVAKGEKLKDTIELQVEPLYKKVGFGSFNAYEITVKNLKKFYLPVTLFFSRTQGIESKDKTIQHILLKPDEKKKIFFKVKVDENLNRRLIYTFPFQVRDISRITINDSFQSTTFEKVISEKEIDEKIKSLVKTNEKVLQKTLEIDCDITSIYIKESKSFSCTIKNTGNKNFNRLEVCMLEKDSSQCEEIKSLINQENIVTFPIYFEEARTNYLQIRTKDITDGGTDIISSENFELKSLDKVTVEISNLEFPKSVKYKDAFKINFTLTKTSGNDIKRAIIYLDISGVRKKLFEESDLKIKTFSALLFGSDLGPDSSKKPAIIIELYDELNNIVTISQDINIELKDLTLVEKIQLYIQGFSQKIYALFS